MKWIEAKMQELGVTKHTDYKLCCMVDSGAMITVHAPKYGVIEVGLTFFLCPFISPTIFYIYIYLCIDFEFKRE